MTIYGDGIIYSWLDELSSEELSDASLATAVEIGRDFLQSAALGLNLEQVQDGRIPLAVATLGEVIAGIPVSGAVAASDDGSLVLSMEASGEAVRTATVGVGVADRGTDAASVATEVDAPGAGSMLGGVPVATDQEQTVPVTVHISGENGAPLSLGAELTAIPSSHLVMATPVDLVGVGRCVGSVVVAADRSEAVAVTVQVAAPAVVPLWTGGEVQVYPSRQAHLATWVEAAQIARVVGGAAVATGPSVAGLLATEVASAGTSDRSLGGEIEILPAGSVELAAEVDQVAATPVSGGVKVGADKTGGIHLAAATIAAETAGLPVGGEVQELPAGALPLGLAAEGETGASVSLVTETDRDGGDAFSLAVLADRPASGSLTLAPQVESAAEGGVSAAVEMSVGRETTLSAGMQVASFRSAGVAAAAETSLERWPAVDLVAGTESQTVSDLVTGIKVGVSTGRAEPMAAEIRPATAASVVVGLEVPERPPVRSRSVDVGFRVSRGPAVEILVRRPNGDLFSGTIRWELYSRSEADLFGPVTDKHELEYLGVIQDGRLQLPSLPGGDYCLVLKHETGILGVTRFSYSPELHGRNLADLWHQLELVVAEATPEFPMPELVPIGGGGGVGGGPTIRVRAALMRDPVLKMTVTQIRKHYMVRARPCPYKEIRLQVEIC